MGNAVTINRLLIVRFGIVQCVLGVGWGGWEFRS